jgi:hypothetical protein
MNMALFKVDKKTGLMNNATATQIIIKKSDKSSQCALRKVTQRDQNAFFFETCMQSCLQFLFMLEMENKRQD